MFQGLWVVGPWRQRTTILGVLVGDLSNPYYAQMAQVTERAAFSHGYRTMFCNIEGAHDVALAGVEALLEHRVAGIVFLAYISRTPLTWQPGSPTIRSGRADVKLSGALRGPHAPSALFVSNDIGAIAMLEACEGEQLRVPRDISIVGFDDIAIAGLHRISLTTVAQRLDFQAERAVSLLLERIRDPGLPPRHTSVPVELRVRHSTARARDRAGSTPG